MHAPLELLRERVWQFQHSPFLEKERRGDQMLAALIAWAESVEQRFKEGKCP